MRREHVTLRKLITTAAATVLAAGSLAACGSGANNGAPTPPLADCVMTFTDPSATGFDDGSGITVKKMGPVLYMAVGVAWVSCVKPPNTLTIDLQLWYKPQGFSGDWREVNSNSASFDKSKPAISGSGMPGAKPVPVPVTSPCVAGQFQIRATALGENNNGQFIMPQVTGNTSVLTAADCHHQ